MKMNTIIRVMAGTLLPAILLTGCYDRLDMEDASFSLVTGLDLDDRNRLVDYSASPVFGKSATKKSQELKVVSGTLRSARGRLDNYSVGVFNGRKVQVLVLSKRLVQSTDWFRYLDVFFRDGRNPITSKVIVFDGPMEELFRHHSPSQPILPLMLIGLIESSATRSEGVKLTLQELHRQMYNDGQTPYLSEMTIDKQDAKITGTALLDQSGRYATTLNPQETILLNMLMEKAGPSVSLTLQLPSETTGVPPERSWISLLTERIRVRIQSAYDDGRFRFKVRVRLTASVMEKLSHVDLDADQAKVEAACAEALRVRLEELIGRLQQYKADPVGFGDYARAYENAAFEKARSDWGKTFGEADVSLRVDVTFADEGSVK